VRRVLHGETQLLSRSLSGEEIRYVPICAQQRVCNSSLCVRLFERSSWMSFRCSVNAPKAACQLRDPGEGGLGRVGGE
jgi:hypothetical protein